ncbi:EAL domain-containing protein [Planomonospora sp. ID67723]|uniref:EAL domain-containing protein n=1 Tax=Planomonospora sp. ID67723 TaxID=2738134 RepID=UPI0018C39976|nr:EAL domain-containing protein [Planomonospora sp. ID67723]MBG0828697.1 EAL domain-containing protein [Planomonospora sp. ID67723]
MAEDRSTRWILWERPAEDRPSFNPGVLWGKKRPGQEQEPAPQSPASQFDMSAATTLSASQLRPSHEQPVGITQHTDLITHIIENRLVEVEFQPVLDVLHNQVVGFEALSRGPRDTPLRAPDRLFAAARAVGRAGELDWICRAEAFRQMLARKMPGAVSLFVNVAADSLIVECPEDLLPVVWEATRQLRVLVELSGEAMDRHPRQVLETVRRARAARWGVSIGDIEFSPAGLAMLPVLEPDVVKLDHHLLTHGRAYMGQALTAALSEAQHSRATLLVENVENQSGHLMGRSLGGNYQRGYFHGRPGELPDTVPQPRAPIRLREAPEDQEAAYWDLAVEAGAHVSSGLSWEEINTLTLTLAGPIAQSPIPPVIGFLLPEGHGWNVEMSIIYRALLARCPLVLVLGSDVAQYGNWRVRGANLPGGHPLLNHGFLIALSPTSALVVLSRQQDAAKDLWEVAISESSELARQLLRHSTDLLDVLEGGVRHAAETA